MAWVKTQAGELYDVCAVGVGRNSCRIFGACNGGSVPLAEYASEAAAQRVLYWFENWLQTSRVRVEGDSPCGPVPWGTTYGNDTPALFVFPQAREVVAQ